ncbi:MAG TPA: hypothetical protein VFA52_02140 [Candidatus Paceibacterota bacterium]|nr:hypothetical protein [Candidatus Paceibacterota bacterium]
MNSQPSFGAMLKATRLGFHECELMPGFLMRLSVKSVGDKILYIETCPWQLIQKLPRSAQRSKRHIICWWEDNLKNQKFLVESALETHAPPNSNYATLLNSAYLESETELPGLEKMKNRSS